MNQIAIRALGVGALEIKIGTKRLLLDAFNSINQPKKINHGDFLIFTHDDADHFSINSLPDVRGLDINIIGPPTIVQPLLQNEKALVNQIKVMHSPNNNEPDKFSFDEFCIKSITTQHFINWKPIHNSYLIEAKGLNIYITGDSNLIKDMADSITDLDVVICNLVDEGFITGRDDRRFAIHHHLSYLLKIISDYHPQKLIGTHLINFAGTVEAEEMKKLVEDYQFTNITIPVSEDEVIIL